MQKGRGYGKILLVGGYTVLKKPNRALVASVENAFVDAEARKSNTWRVKSEYGEWEGKDPNKIPDELRFVRHAILESGVPEPHNIEIKNSDLLRAGKKLGLGSSAAVTHAVIEALQPKIDKKELFAKAFRAHSAAQGKIGSGFDVASSVFGTIEYERPSGLDVKDHKVNSVSVPPNFHILVCNIRGGGTDSPVSAKKVLKAVETKPEAKKIFDRLAELNNSAVRLFKEGKVSEFLKVLKDINTHRRRLGELSDVPIEPKELDEIREEIEKKGYTTVLPGAGGFDSLVVVGSKPVKPIKHELLEEVSVLLRKGRHTQI